MSFILRLLIHARRTMGAFRFGIPYFRAASLKIPERLKVAGEWIRIDLPDDVGIKSDILGCLLEDAYGLGNLARPPATILDIGANVGLFGIAARSRFPHAVIHAYEPNPRTLPYLEHQGRVGKFAVFPEAVGSTAGTVYIDDFGDTNLARTKLAPTSSAPVTKVSLSKAIERLGGMVSFAKIDCEGAEWDLFEDREAWKCIERVRMEYHLFDKQTFEQVTEILHELGFVIVKHQPGTGAGIIWCERMAS